MGPRVEATHEYGFSGFEALRAGPLRRGGRARSPRSMSGRARSRASSRRSNRANSRTGMRRSASSASGTRSRAAFARARWSTWTPRKRRSASPSMRRSGWQAGMIREQGRGGLLQAPSRKARRSAYVRPSPRRRGDGYRCVAAHPPRADEFPAGRPRRHARNPDQLLRGRQPGRARPARHVRREARCRGSYGKRASGPAPEPRTLHRALSPLGSGNRRIALCERACLPRRGRNRSRRCDDRHGRRYDLTRNLLRRRDGLLRFRVNRRESHYQ